MERQVFAPWLEIYIAGATSILPDGAAPRFIFYDAVHWQDRISYIYTPGQLRDWSLRTGRDHFSQSFGRQKIGNF